MNREQEQEENTVREDRRNISVGDVCVIAHVCVHSHMCCVFILLTSFVLILILLCKHTNYDE